MKNYNDQEGEFFGRINEDGNVDVLNVEDGSAATRMDCNLYPVDSETSVKHEHPEGITLTVEDAAKIGLVIE